jgi:hypothetical protein
MGMTWKVKVAKVAMALAIVAALAVASGANWVDDVYSFLGGWL